MPKKGLVMQCDHSPQSKSFKLNAAMHSHLQAWGESKMDWFECF